LSDLSLS